MPGVVIRIIVVAVLVGAFVVTPILVFEAKENQTTLRRKLKKIRAYNAYIKSLYRKDEYKPYMVASLSNDCKKLELAILKGIRGRAAVKKVKDECRYILMKNADPGFAKAEWYEKAYKKMYKITT